MSLNYAKAREQKLSANRSKRLDYSVKCPYCLDKKFVFVKPDWILNLSIPFDPDVSDLLFTRSDNVAIPCDCHEGTVNDIDKIKNGECPPMPVTRFHHIFGETVFDSQYGKNLKTFRQAQVDSRQSGDQSGPEIEIGDLVYNLVLENKGLWD